VAPEEQFLPNPVGKNGDEMVFYVNGIATDLAKQMEDMENIAAHGRQVVGVHNATAGLVRDLAQCVGDKLGTGDNPAVSTVKSLIKTSLATGTKVTLVGHSQGALVCSRALWELQDEAATCGPEEAWSDSISDVKLETAGGAAYTYPAGPSYHHIVNKYDIVPIIAGLGTCLPGIDPGTEQPLEVVSRVQAPYVKESDSVYEMAMGLLDRTVHGTEVYYNRDS